MISVIIPVYNVEEYLKDCIESVCGQTYTDLEIILVDDGSTDNSGIICDQYSQTDSRIKVIHKSNGGLSDARNAGIDIAAGDYIGFVDSDDIIHAKMYETLFFLAKKENADIVVCKSISFEGIEDLWPEVDENTQERQEVFNKENALIELFRGEKYFVSAWDKLYRAELFENVRYPFGKIHEDMFTTYKLFLKSKTVAFTSQRLYGYRLRENSITHSDFNGRRFDNLEAIQEIIKFFECYPKKITEVINRMAYFKSLYILNLICEGTSGLSSLKYYRKYRQFVVKNRNLLLDSSIESKEKRHINRVCRSKLVYYYYYKHQETINRFTIKRISGKIKRLFLGEKT